MSENKQSPAQPGSSSPMVEQIAQQQQAKAGGGGDDEKGLLDALPLEIATEYERQARNLANLWTNGNDGARTCILAALARANRDGAHAVSVPVQASANDGAWLVIEELEAAVRDANFRAQCSEEDECDALGRAEDAECTLSVLRANIREAAQRFEALAVEQFAFGSEADDCNSPKLADECRREGRTYRRCSEELLKLIEPDASLAQGAA